MKRKKYITRIGDFRVTRPAKDHPDPAYWQQLRTEVVVAQRGRCGTCWGEGSDLHHRHYNNWGRELREDVVLLCRPCHEAVTSRVRSERYGMGDRTLGFEDRTVKEEFFRAAEKAVRGFIRPAPEKKDGDGFRPKSRQELVSAAQAKATQGES
jgi:hypothetical protein